MDKWTVLSWLLQDAAEFADSYLPDPDKDLGELLVELNTRKEIALPENLEKIKDPQEMLRLLRQHFKDNVTFISLVLNHYFPQDFIFYRVSKLEDEIFEGLDFFSEIWPEFGFHFTRVGRSGVGRYLELNAALLNFRDTYWSAEEEEANARLHYFLYEGLGSLFRRRSTQQRYWIMTTREEYFAGLDEQEEVVWSGRKEMQEGDLVFMYRTAPRKALTELYRVKEDPTFDAWSGWDGFWVNLVKVATIPDIPFSELRTDPVLGQWGTVVKQFQGTVTEPMPPVIYNRLLEKLPASVLEQAELQAAAVVEIGASGQFTSEAEFEEKIIIPFLQRSAFDYTRQHPCLFHFGSQNHRGRLDFHVSDNKGPLTVVEAKLRIISDPELNEALDQAKSYALMLGMPTFVVASPEAFWLYSLERNKARLELKIASTELEGRGRELRELLVRLRD